MYACVINSTTKLNDDDIIKCFEDRSTMRELVVYREREKIERRRENRALYPSYNSNIRYFAPLL